MGGKAKDPYKAQRAAERARIARLQAIDLPELEEYVLQNPELVGLLEAEQLGPSALEDISLDPAMKEKQMMALQGLQERSEQGLTAMDKLQMEEMLGQASAAEKSARAGIEAEMQRRGTADSGASLMSKLQGAQGAGNQARQKAMQMAAQGAQQRMAALQGMGQMAGQMESADYQRQSAQASAADRIAQANAMNRQNISAANLAARQQQENQRANIANQQAQIANQIAQQRFSNEMARAGSMNTVASTPAAPQGPSGFQQLATIGGGIAGFMGGGPAGAAAGAQAGSMIGGAFNFQDGGIAQSKEMKAHEKFKADYMKKVREELMPKERAIKEVTGVIHAQDGAFAEKFRKSRAALGPGASFMWNGNEYSTDLAEESAPQTLASEQKPEMPNMFNFDQANKDIAESIKTGKAQGGVEQIAGVTNDKINEQDPTPTPKKEGSSFGAKDFEAIGKIAGMLSPKEEAPQEIKNTFQLQKPENIMSPIQAQQFGNAFSGAKFEDGGMPEYGCGGTHKAEDGDMMYASDGYGDIVDSGMESYAGDRVDAKINDGEMILNVPQQQRLMDIIRGTEDLTALGDEDIIEGVPRDYRDELHEKGEESGSDKKMEGLKRLLEALGE